MIEEKRLSGKTTQEPDRYKRTSSSKETSSNEDEVPDEDPWLCLNCTELNQEPTEKDIKLAMNDASMHLKENERANLADQPADQAAPAG